MDYTFREVKMKNLYEPFQQVEAEVVAVSDDTIFIDLGTKSEGIVEKSEFTDENSVCSVKEGDRIKVFFTGEKNGELHFAAKIGGKNAGKSALENAFKNSLPLEGKVTAETKGGFDVEIGGVRAFCPYSQMGFRQKKEPSEWIGEKLNFKIIEFKNDGRNIVVSNRIIQEENESAKIKSLSRKFTEGETAECTVKSMESYGAFVDLGGFQALLPVSEISHARVEKVSDVLTEGQKIRVKIIRADWAHQKVSVSMKALEEDPWKNFSEKFSAGTKIEGKISRIAEFGIFVSVADGIDGLVHVSKLPVERKTNLKKIYHPGEKIPVVIEKIDAEEKRVSLSPVVSSEEEKIAQEYLGAQDDDGEKYNPFAVLLKK